MMIEEGIKYSRNQEVLSAPIDDEIGFMDISRGSYYTMDPIGKRIWELLVNPQTIGELVDELTREYRVEKDICYKDVRIFMEKMLKNHLIKQ